MGNSLTEDVTVVVGHSLGSVVAYSVLRNDRRALKVPAFITVGSPLGVRALRDTFRPLRLSRLAQELDDGAYWRSWYDEPAAHASETPDENPAGLTSHF